MKKIVLALLIGLLGLSVNAYETYNVPGDSYDYSFNFYNKGENIGVELGGDIIPISSDNVYYEYHEPIFASAINWSTVIKGSAISPVTYSILGLSSTNENGIYNAAAESLYANGMEHNG